jgi:hypothetical protein
MLKFLGAWSLADGAWIAASPSSWSRFWNRVLIKAGQRRVVSLPLALTEIAIGLWFLRAFEGRRRFSFRSVRRLPLFPLIPLAPILMFSSVIGLQSLSLGRLRRLNRRIDQLPGAMVAGEGVYQPS